MPHIIIKGDPLDGFEYIGPFDERADAEEYMDQNSNDTLWCIELIDPTEPDEEAA